MVYNDGPATRAEWCTAKSRRESFESDATQQGAWDGSRGALDAARRDRLGGRQAGGATPGAALAEFLRQKQFTARHAVVGLPAKWLLVKTKEVPPADSKTASDLLRLQAEGDFSSELRDLVFEPDAGRPTEDGDHP